MSKLRVLLLDHNLQAHWQKKPRPFLTLPEAGDKDIFALFNGFLHNLQKGVNELGGANIGKAAMVMDGFSDVGLGEGHGESPAFFKQISLLDFQGYVKRLLDQGFHLTSPLPNKSVTIVFFTKNGLNRERS
jgi:hypothetical protein